MHLYVYIIYISIYNNHFGQYFDNKLDIKKLPEAFVLKFMNLFSFLFLNIKIIPTRNVGSVIPFALIFCFVCFFLERGSVSGDCDYLKLCELVHSFPHSPG